MTKINDGWLSVECLPDPKDGTRHLFWDADHGIIHGQWCEYEDELVGTPGFPDAEWEFHTFDGRYLPDADPHLWHPLPDIPRQEP